LKKNKQNKTNKNKKQTTKKTIKHAFSKKYSSTPLAALLLMTQRHPHLRHYRQSLENTSDECEPAVEKRHWLNSLKRHLPLENT
jgi:hypothetical protein